MGCQEIFLLAARHSQTGTYPRKGVQYGLVETGGERSERGCNTDRIPILARNRLGAERGGVGLDGKGALKREGRTAPPVMLW